MAKNIAVRKIDAIMTVSIMAILVLIIVLLGFSLTYSYEETIQAEHRNDELIHIYESKLEDYKLDRQKELSTVYRDGFKAGKHSVIVGKPYQPVTNLEPSKEKKCLALLVYSESRGTLRDDAMDIMWAGINRAEDPRRDRMFRGSVCGIAKAGAGVQFEGMTPYIKAVNDIVWGVDNNYVPFSARKEGSDRDAWLAIVKMANDAFDGKLAKTTEANHFIQFQSLKGSVPSWVRDLKPVGVSANHILLTDVETIDNKRVRYTKENPYRPLSDW